MTVTIKQCPRQVVVIQERPRQMIQIRESRPSVITIKAQGPVGPQGPLRDDTDYLAYYELARG